MGVIWGMNKIMPSAKYYATVGLMLNGRHGLCVSYSSILCRQAFKLVMKPSANYLNDIIPGNGMCMPAMSIFFSLAYLMKRLRVFIAFSLSMSYDAQYSG